MKIVETIEEMQKLSESLRQSGRTIACVPTMGYLHEGHLSLVDAAKNHADIIIVTLFVNPAQFAPNEDLSRYPRDFKRDAELLDSHGCDYLFSPNENDVYPQGFSSYVTVENISSKFEGNFRPEHFRGVATIVAKLFNIIKPDVAIFGQKDYQQTLVVKKMVMDLNFLTKIIVSPTIREEDGLAKSSRNIYLNISNRKKAVIISKTLFDTEKLIRGGLLNRDEINNKMAAQLSQGSDLEIDYSSAAIADNLEEPDYFKPGDEIILLIAIRLGGTRLIDNLLIKI